MKSIFLILSIGLILFLGSCAQKKSNDNAVSVKVESLPSGSMAGAKPPNVVKLKQLDEEVNDSLYLSSILQKALNIAQKNSKQPNFTEKFETESDSFGYIETNIAVGYFFSKRYKHLVINRGGAAGEYINIYRVRGKKNQPVLFHHQEPMTHIKDTLQDVNGDGYKDFVVDWYASSGCCLKAFNDVYLYLPKTGKFSGGFRFINPTYSPKEKVIRGVCYGHPGETEMYKYKWNGLKVDTIEYIYHNKNRKGHYLKSKAFPDDNKYVKKIKLRHVPKEYMQINGFDWFMGFN